MLIIKSKFRSGYFGQKIFLFCFISAIIIYLINLTVTNEKIISDNGKFWAVCILISFLLYGIYSLCIKEFQNITITEEIIISNNILTKQKTIIRFNEIAKFASTRNTFKSEGVPVSDGHLVLEIELKNGKLFHFSENEYENFHELKRFIYDHVKI